MNDQGQEMAGCGCTIEHAASSSDEGYIKESITYCPMHKAAHAMLKALERYANADQLAASFHETYEYLAPDYDYKTREDSAVHWKDVPEQNKKLMIATARLIGTAARDAIAQAEGAAG